MVDCVYIFGQNAISGSHFKHWVQMYQINSLVMSLHTQWVFTPTKICLPFKAKLLMFVHLRGSVFDQRGQVCCLFCFFFLFPSVCHFIQLMCELVCQDIKQPCLCIFKYSGVWKLSLAGITTCAFLDCFPIMQRCSRSFPGHFDHCCDFLFYLWRSQKMQ